MLWSMRDLRVEVWNQDMETQDTRKERPIPKRFAASLEQPPVQRAELDRLRYLVAADVLLAREVGDGTGKKFICSMGLPDRMCS